MMSDNTKMREGKLWAFLHDSIHEAYKKLSTTGTSNEYYALLGSIASKVADDVDARFLQAAQSVPVMGDAVAYGVPNSAITGMRHRLMQVMLDIPKQAQYPELLVPLFEKPTTCITQAELDAKDARIRELEEQKS
jgi:hypothetical protein